MGTGRFSKQLFFLIAILLISSHMTLAKTITVGRNNAAGLDYDYEKIQPAIDASLGGDTIIVAQGQYSETINFKSKNIILTSTDPNDWDVVENTIIDPPGNDAIVTFSGRETEICILEGFNIKGGKIGIWGSKTKATIRKCYIQGNQSTTHGGGLYDFDGLIDDCIISNNSAVYKDSIAKGAGLFGCDGTIRNCVIKNNRAGSSSSWGSGTSSGEGGGLYGCNGQIIGCTIEENHSRGNGGGLHSCNVIIKDSVIKDNEAGTNELSKGGGFYNCNGEIINCSIKNNSAQKDGGGLYNCLADINNCTIENNSALENGGGLSNCKRKIINCIIRNNSSTKKGGGLHECNGTIIGCTIENNSALENGGGLYDCNGKIINCTIKDNESTNGSGGALSNCMGTIEDCTIQGNMSNLWHAGGAIDCNSVINCTITGNKARGYGGGLYNCKEVDRCTISGNISEIFPGGGLSDCNSVTNCIISGNIAGGNGAGLYNCNEIINCTIIGNYSQKKAGALYFKGNYGIIDNTIIWENRAYDGWQVLVECIEPNIAEWNLSIDYSDVYIGPNDILVEEGAVLKWEPNNIDLYPMFVQPGRWTVQNNQNIWNEGNYHLLHSSPCIDAGNPGRDYTDQNDIDGDARLIGQFVDIGADEVKEYVPPVFAQLEINGPEQVTEGETGQYSATGRYDDDSEINLTNEVIWSVEPEGIGTIDANGLFSVGELDEDTEVTIKATYTHGDQEVLYIAQMTVLCVDIPASSITYYVDSATGNDLNDGLSRQTAFKTIQNGIDSSKDNDTVLVYPGVYREGLVFWGKNITLKSAEDAAVIENPDNIAVLFCFEETSECKIQNFIIKNSKIAILNILNSSPTIKNLTIVKNYTGIECFDSNPDISNCIFWYNEGLDFVNCLPKFSCMEDDYATWNILNGNIRFNPLFVDPDDGDFHLKSERGRYWPQFDIWVLDNESSPCIDAGNPQDNYSKERQPNGGRINIGAYGNTYYASMSILEDEQYKASQPNPTNGAINISTRPTLIWNAGVDAVQHDIYLGTSLDDVRDATRDNPLGTLISQGQNATSYPATSYAYPLQYNQVYFWRVDEINSSGTITKGNVWTFITMEGNTKGRGCFTGQTPVWIDGETIEISKAAKGQSVNTTSCPEGFEIKQLLEHEGTFDLYDITLESGEIITVANNHYFMVESGLWISLHDLKAGMNLKTANGVMKIKSISKQSQPFTGKVYNLDIKDSDTYMVGKDALIVRDY